MTENAILGDSGARAEVRTPAELFDLSGKIALVTGGSRGLGRAIGPLLRVDGLEPV